MTFCLRVNKLKLRAGLPIGTALLKVLIHILQGNVGLVYFVQSTQASVNN